jgi:hypothetical protein
LLLGRARKRRVALSLAHAGLASPVPSRPGVPTPVQSWTGPVRDAGRLSPVSPPSPAATSAPPAAAPSPPAALQPGRVRRRAPAAARDLAPGAPLTGRTQAGLVVALLAAAAAVAWLLGRARKRRVP